MMLLVDHYEEIELARRNSDRDVYFAKSTRFDTLQSDMLFNSTRRREVALDFRGQVFEYLPFFRRGTHLRVCSV